MAFPDFLYSTPNVLGLSLSMIGAVWYAMQSAMRVRPCLLSGILLRLLQLFAVVTPHCPCIRRASNLLGLLVLDMDSRLSTAAADHVLS